MRRLTVVEHCGLPKTRAVLVGTHSDELEGDEYERLSGWLSQLKERWRDACPVSSAVLVNAHHAENVQRSVLPAIRDCAKELVKGEVTPKSTRVLREALERYLARAGVARWLPVSDTLKLLAEDARFGLGHDKAIRALGELVRTGAVLLLEPFVVLDPGWMSRAVSLIVRPHRVPFNGMPLPGGVGTLDMLRSSLQHELKLSEQFSTELMGLLQGLLLIVPLNPPACTRFLVPSRLVPIMLVFPCLMYGLPGAGNPSGSGICAPGGSRDRSSFRGFQSLSSWVLGHPHVLTGCA